MVFSKPITKQFEFDTDVASVFDDMLNRSVPYYKESLELATNFALKFLKDNDFVYDLGCSTASTLLNLSQNSDLNLHLVGIDNSIAMIQRAEQKSKLFKSNIKFICDDISNIDNIIVSPAKVIFANYTLQFIRPLMREKLIQKIYNSLEDGGVFIFSEKVISKNSVLNKNLIDEYYKFKKSKGYSEYEIAQKREALENILIPYTETENREMLQKAGFSHIELIFRWCNFSTFLAFK